MIISLIFVTQYQLVEEIKNINKGVLAYADCSNEMMHFAFTNPTEVFNFSDCYHKKIKSIDLNCVYNGTSILCNYNSEKFVFVINESNIK